jgi:hypothetical protein
VSCNVQEVKLVVGKPSEWQRWVRISRKNGSV